MYKGIIIGRVTYTFMKKSKSQKNLDKCSLKSKIPKMTVKNTMPNKTFNHNTWKKIYYMKKIKQ